MSPQSPLVSVVVPAWNAQETIEECVRSLLAQSYPRDRLEIIVVDNGSSDATRERLAPFEDSIAILSEATRGAAAARNAGIRHASGEIVAFTDSDCTVDEHWLTELVWPLSDLTVGVVGGPILARRPAGEAELFGEAIHDHAAAMLVCAPPYAVTMNWASRAEVLAEVGLFDEALRRAQDGDLAYRVLTAGYRLGYLPLRGRLSPQREHRPRSLPGRLAAWLPRRQGQAQTQRTPNQGVEETSEAVSTVEALALSPDPLSASVPVWQADWNGLRYRRIALSPLAVVRAGSETASKPQVAPQQRLSGREADEMPSEPRDLRLEAAR